MESRSQLRFDLIVIAAIFLVILAVYGNVLGHPFMLEDEQLLSFWSKPFSWESFSSCFKSSGQDYTYYRPIPSLFYLSLFSLASGSALYYRMASFLLYAIFLALTYFFTKELFRNRYAAVLTVFLFCVHPLNGFYLYSISASANLIWGILMLSVLLTHLFYSKGAGKFWCWVSYALTLAALATYEMAVTLPGYIFILDMYAKKSWQEAARKAFSYVVIIVVWQIFRALFVSSTKALPGMMAAGASALGLGPDNYLPTLVVLTGWYFKQLVWPTQVLFAKMIQPIQGDLFVWNVGIIAFIVLLSVVLLRSNNQRLRLSVLWFLVGLAPMSLAALIYPSEGILIEPHWFMVGCVSFYWGIAWIFQTIRQKFGSLPSVIIFIMVLVMTAVYTQKYNYLWHNQRSYCLYWLSLESQQQLPNFWLATDYLNTNELPKARAYFLRALTNSSIDWEVYVNLGTISYKEGKLQEAILWNQKALMLNPKSADAFNNLGIVAWEQKDGVSAREFFKKAIAADPSFYKAADNLKIISAKMQ